MPAVIVNEDRCQSSQVCVDVCPYNAIDMVSNERGREVARINDRCVDCMLCVPACPQKAILLVAAYGMATEPDVYRGIWAVVPDVSPTSLGFVTRANALAQSMHAWTGVVLLGSDQNETALRSVGADTVIRHGPLSVANSAALLDELTELVDERQPEAMLFVDSPPVCDLATRLAGRLELDLVTDVYDIEHDRRERRLLFHKGAGSPARDTVITTTSRPQLAVLRSTA